MEGKIHNHWVHVLYYVIAKVALVKHACLTEVAIDTICNFFLKFGANLQEIINL